LNVVNSIFLLTQATCLCFKMDPIGKMRFSLIKSTSSPDYFSKKVILIDKILAFLQAFGLVFFFFQDCTKWDLGQATSDITLGTGLKDSRDF